MTVPSKPRSEAPSAEALSAESFSAESFGAESFSSGVPGGAPPTTDRRRWLAGTLAGAACVTFAEAALAGEPAPAEKRVLPADGEALAALLQRNRGFRPDYRGGLSNHLSMALYSLAALGAGDAELRRLADSQWARLEPLPSEPGASVDAARWTARLGQRDAINGYRALFTQEIARSGREATLRRFLPGLLPGIGAAAFHPLIRVGYGVRFGDDREVADGLAYWATEFTPLGSLGRAGTERDPRALLARIHATPALAGLDPPGYLINGKMKTAAALPGFAPIVDTLAPTDGTLPLLAAASVRLYLDKGDFTALHAVTGTHAYRMIEPYVTAPELGLRYLWQAVAAAYVSIGAPRVADPASAESAGAPAWKESLARARQSRDAHDIKLVDIAHQQGLFYGDAVYRRAAALRLG